MLRKPNYISDEDSGKVAFDWVVLAAGIVSLGMAVTLTATHDASAKSQPFSSAIMAELTAH